MHEAKRLSGGAIQENWLLDVTTGGKPRGLVVRKDAPAAARGRDNARPSGFLHRQLHRRRPGLTAVLDWEFAAWGDPMLDLGWLCTECWRCSRKDLEAGGIGSRAAVTKPAALTPEERGAVGLQ